MKPFTSYLVDTHILIWAVANTPRLPAAARDILSDPTCEFHFSAASIWEIALKSAKHPADIPLTAREARQAFLDAGFRELATDSEAASAVNDLPRIHGDPFDRLLLSQSRQFGMMLLTHDHLLAPYGENVVTV